MLLLAALPSSWRPFITTQASVVGLTVETLIARILQEDAMHSSTSSTPATGPASAQNVQRTAGHFAGRNNRRPFRRSGGVPRNPSNNNPAVQTCGYCGRHGHAERDCRTKRRDQQRNDRRPRANLQRVEEPALGQYGIDTLQLFTSYLHSANVLVTARDAATEWLLDTGATHHMTAHRHWLQDYKSFTQQVRVYLGDNRSLTAAGLGKMQVVLPSGTSVLIHDIYHIPGLSRNLLSVFAATSTGSSIEFFHGSCVIHFKLPSGQYEIIKLPQVTRLYPIMISQPGRHAVIASTSTLSLNVTKATATLLWHYRLGHINSPTLHRMAKNQLCNGIPQRLSPIDLCEGCLLGKSSHKPFPRSHTRSTQVNQLVHSDVCGPMETTSLTGSTYFLTFTDDFCRYTTVYFLKKKSQVFAYFKDYCILALR